MERKVAIRLGTTGKAEVKQDLAEIGAAGKAGFGAVGEAADAAAKRATGQFERATAEIEAAQRRQAAAAAKLSAIAPKSAIQMQVENASGSYGRGGIVEQAGGRQAVTDYEGSARRAAAAFRELIAEQEKAEAKARAIKAAVDPLWAAEQQLARDLDQVAIAQRAGILTTDELTQARARAQAQFEKARTALSGSTGPAMGDAADAHVRAYWKAAADEQERAAVAARGLRMELDPLWAAEQKLEEQLKRIAIAQRSEALTSDLAAQAQMRARKEYDDTTAALRRQETAGKSLSMMQRQTLIYTASDILASGASGMSPGMIAMQQGPQVLQAFAAEEGGIAKLRAMLSGTVLAVAGLSAAVILGAKAWYDYSAAVEKLNALAVGSGRVLGATGGELEAIAESAATAGDMSVTAAREIEAGYVQMGGIGKGVLADLTALTRDFAAATAQDAAGATRELGTAFADPAAGAEALAARYGVLDQATISYIQQLVEQGEQLKAQQVLLSALAPAFDGAADHANGLAKAWRWISREAENAYDWMGRFIDRALGGGTVAEQISDLQRERGRAASYGVKDLSNFDRQIADLRSRLKNVDISAQRVAQQQAAGIVEQYNGADVRAGYRAAAGKLRAALKTDMAPADREQITATLSAYTNAIDTFIPKQEKANQLAAIDARIAAAKTPQAKAALATERARIESAGQLVSASDAEARALAAGTRARNQAASSGQNHAETLRRQAEALEASARGALDVADAYLRGSAAGMQAEAVRKALTEATRAGTDAEAQARRQIALQIAEGVAGGARSVAQLRDETATRKAVNDQVSAGSLAVARMADALADENTLRPLLILQANAQGDALAKLTKVIDAYRLAMAAAREEEARSAAKTAIAAGDERIIGLRDQMEFAGDRSGRGAIEIARRAAEREAQDRRWTGQQAEDFVNNRVTEAREGQRAERTRSLAEQRNSQADALALTRAEIDLVGASEDKREAILGLLRVELDLRARGIDLASAQAQAVLEGASAQAQANAKLRAASADMAELTQFGERFVDSVLSKEAWSSWGDLGKTVLRELKAELLKLALLNPLKNLISGGNAPTLTSVIGKLGTIFSPGRNATGTEYWSGGMTWVGENGAELVDLPRGSRVTPAGESRRLLAAANDSGPPVQIFDLRGAVVQEDLYRHMQAVGAAAATRGAIGGSRLATQRAAQAARRRLR